MKKNIIIALLISLISSEYLQGQNLNPLEHMPFGKVKSIKVKYSILDSFIMTENEETVMDNYYVEYDINGVFSKKEFYSKGGKVIINIKAQVNWRDGKLIAKDYFVILDEPVKKEIFIYDDNGTIIACTEYNQHGGEMSNTTYTYNDKKQLIEAKTKAKGKEYSETKEYKYNDKDISTFYYPPNNSDTPESILQCTKNSQGDILERRYTKSAISDTPQITTYEYEYDDNNNWIKQTSYKDGKSYLSAEREIEYYENAEE
ncbi:MAG: hypothetical protein ACK5IQ_03055 [Bacteroidales bacterium]